MIQQPRDTKSGKFGSEYKEKRGEVIALRLPQSLDQEVRDRAGWKSAADNYKLKEYVEAAIREKLERDSTV